jgi:hypothetical protein
LARHPPRRSCALRYRYRLRESFSDEPEPQRHLKYSVGNYMILAIGPLSQLSDRSKLLTPTSE